jgi:hypothetical protein
VQDASHTKASLEDIHQWVHPSRAFRLQYCCFIFQLKIFIHCMQLNTACWDMASFSKPEPVTSMDKFLYGELVILD